MIFNFKADYLKEHDYALSGRSQFELQHLALLYKTNTHAMVFNDKPWQCEFYELSLKKPQAPEEDDFDIAFLETSIGSRRYSQYDQNLN